MVHALTQCHRVLKEDGLLFDLRPASVHMKIGILYDGQFEFLGQMEETFDNDYVANDAVSTVLEQGLFENIWQTQLEVRRYMETFEDFDEWLKDFKSLATNLKSHQWLLDKAKQALESYPDSAKMMATGPINLMVMQKKQVPQ